MDWSYTYRYPPFPTEQSDEDSGDEDDNSTSIDNLTGRFLRDIVEVTLKSLNQGADKDDQTQDVSCFVPASSKRKTEEGETRTLPLVKRRKRTKTEKVLTDAGTKKADIVNGNKEGGNKRTGTMKNHNESELLCWEFVERDISQKEADAIPYTAKPSPTTALQLDAVGFLNCFLTVSSSI